MGFNIGGAIMGGLSGFATGGPAGAAIGALVDVVKAIFGPFIEIFSKITSFFAIVATGFIANQGIDGYQRIGRKFQDSSIGWGNMDI